jgi:hypothetical protein
MANTIIELRRSNVSGNVPTSLANGEIAINTYDGKLFYRGGASNTIQTIERFEGPAGLDGEIQFNDSGVLGSSNKFTFNKTTGLLTVSDTINVSGRDLSAYINAAFIHANSAFDAANTSTGGNSFGVIYTSNNSTFANAASANDQVNFVGESGVVVFANAVTKTITVAGTPGAQGLTVDYGYVYDALNYSIDYGTL